MSLRSIVTRPPPHIRSLPLNRTRSATMTYGSTESVAVLSAEPRYQMVGRDVAYISNVSRTPGTARQ